MFWPWHKDLEAVVIRSKDGRTFKIHKSDKTSWYMLTLSNVIDHHWYHFVQQESRSNAVLTFDLQFDLAINKSVPNLFQINKSTWSIVGVGKWPN